MDKNSVNISEERIKNAGSDSNTSNVKSNNANNDRRVFEENSGAIYSVGDVIDTAAKHHGIRTDVSDVVNKGNNTTNASSNNTSNQGCKIK